jgi:hypothetical protein
MAKRLAKRLLDRQVSLLAYLTSGAAIFGNEAEGPADPALAGFDRQLLQFEARFSHEKRMEKIAGVFARTLELLGDEQAEVIRAFAERCPSVSIGRRMRGSSMASSRGSGDSGHRDCPIS